MKWVFLLRQESCLATDTSFYEFVPYQYGPFSFVIYRDLSELARDGYLSEGEGYSVPSHMREQAEDLVETVPVKVRTAVEAVITRYGALSQDELVKHVYARHPWFASRSKLGNARRPATSAKLAVYTVGYEGESVDHFFQKLLKAGIQRLVDVRRNPISRKYGFSKGAMGRLCERMEIEYVHMPELGVPSALRKSLDTYDDYQQLMDHYERSILPTATDARQKTGELLEERPTALVCFEANVSCCHRGRLATAISRETEMEVVHL